MTEDDARGWIGSRWGDNAAARLDQFAAMVVAENGRQNLISTATIPSMWSRHIVDSAQLIAVAGPIPGMWFDVGTGGGFPGIVIAVLRSDPITLIEPRRRRAEFLTEVVSKLGLVDVAVRCERVERLSGTPAIVSARAVKAPAAFFALVRGVTTRDTRFVLPGGRDAEHALEEVRRHWRGVFHVEQSVTDPASRIIVASDVRPR